MNLNYQRLELGKLLFDPNNYRFLDNNPAPPIAMKRFHEPAVQDNAFKKLKEDSAFQPLKDSILRNGFLPSEPLVVRKYDENKFVIIDGNRRAAAVKSLIAEYQNGSDHDKGLIESLNDIPAVIVSIGEGEEPVYKILMGVRHLSGVKRWGGYAEARLINDLVETGGQPADIVAERIGLDTSEINRRQRAFKATEQFRNHGEFRKYFKTEMYALFHEAVAIPGIRDRYKWDNVKMLFADPEATSAFFSLLVPHREDDREIEAKLKTFGDVRKFGKQIVANDDLVSQLQQPEATLDGIIANMERDRDEREWSLKIKKLLKQLNQIPALAVSRATEEEKSVLLEAKAAIETLLKQTNG